MQIHISWKTLIAALIFIFGIALLLRVSINLLSPPAQQATSLTPTITAITPSVAGGTGTEVSATLVPAASSTADTNAPTQTASPTPEPPTPTLAAEPTPAPTLAAEPTPAPTLPPPTETPAPPPTRMPTPAPAQLRILDQGFGQGSAQMSYAFVVSNPNPDLLAQAVRYQVAVYDADGVVLATDTDTIAQIGPGQDLGIAKELRMASDLVVARVEVLLRPGQFVRSPPIETLMVSNPAFVVGNPPNLTGIINNTLGRDLIDVTVFGIAYDDQGIIGGGNSVVPFIPAQGQAAVSVPVETSLNTTRVAFWVNLVSVPAAPATP